MADMGPEHEAHLQRIKDTLLTEIDAKYRAGQATHGGHLWLKTGMLDRAIEEVLDLAVYLYTAREQQARTYDDIQIGAQRVCCYVCGKSFDMTHPQPICWKCREP